MSLRGTRGIDLARRTGALLLDLYEMARTLPLDRFQDATLSRLRDQLPFRSAYWGMLRVQPRGALTLHCSYVDVLPHDFVRDWEAVKHKDVLAAKVVAVPGVAASTTATSMGHAEFAAMGERFDIASAISVAVGTPVPGLFAFLSLYRPADAPQFDRADRTFQEIIMPHVAAAWHANRLHHVEGLRTGLDRLQEGFGVADRHGLLHASEATFAALMGLEWPRWRGPELPRALRDAVNAGRSYDGRALRVEVARHHDLAVLRCHPRDLTARLSPRETEIVALYREGRSYKEIAAHLGCSPYTVRHHLRAIYDKLGVRNKVALLHRTGGLGAP
jgi:DNA-binding CsgD family transcriptional regulator